MLRNMALMAYVDELRISKKLRIETVVQDVVSRRSYSRYLTGDSLVSFATLIKFLTNMNVSLKEFSFYVFQSLNLNNQDEVAFCDALQIGDFQLAKKLYDQSIKGKTLMTEIGEKVIPVGIPYLLYEIGEMTKERAVYEMRRMINLTQLVNGSMIQDSMIINLFLYVSIANDHDKLMIFDFLYRLMKTKESRIFAERFENSQMLLYVTAIKCLTTLTTITKMQEKQMNSILRKALEFHIMARIHTADYFLFDTLLMYCRKSKITNSVVVYYYVTTCLTSPSNYLKQKKIHLTKQEYEAYVNCIKDDAFYEEKMYKRLIKHGIYK